MAYSNPLVGSRDAGLDRADMPRDVVTGESRLVRTAVRTWFLSLVALVAAGAGMAVLTTNGPTTSLTRMGFAAAVLSIYAAAIGLLTTRRSERTRLRCLVWGGGVPTLVGVGTGILVATVAGLTAGLLAALPWLVGTVFAWAAGPYLPGLRLPPPRRTSRKTGPV
jgi:hypothetical protein